MKIKKNIWLSVLIIFTVLASLNAESLKNSPENKLVIGYSGAPSNVDFWNKLKRSLFLRAKELDVIVIDFSAHNFTLEAQKAALIRAVELKVDGMIIGAVSQEIADSIDMFRINKIPVVAVNMPIENEWISTTIATNNQKAAELAGKFLLDRLKKKGDKAKRVVILCGDKVQEDALIRARVPHNILLDAGYDVHDYYAKEWSSKYSLMDAISEYKNNAEDIVALFSCYAGASIAGVEVAESFAKRPIQVGFDMDKNMRKMIKTGRLDATVIQNPQEIGRVGIQSIVKLLKEDKPLSDLIEIPARLITRDNIDKL
ncbi:hypothetical protein DRO03_11670 [Methanosarcinales archaeon]|nr:MAG: hypothetical protein DRO03_11670 [Methanosarcinales archaeon]